MNNLASQNNHISQCDNVAERKTTSSYIPRRDSRPSRRMTCLVNTVGSSKRCPDEFAADLLVLAEVALKKHDLRKIRSITQELEQRSKNNETDEDEVDVAENDDETVYPSLFAGLFHRVTCDEGHKLNYYRTTNSIAVDELYTPKKWIVPANPMVNRIPNLLGYLYRFLGSKVDLRR
ncbi:uncharacterized protein A1O5_13099 [Cladophialophora psammophila CBS 110553]|uniref:Uncharacterized protein n=1 Tax=Cladophialophora psammophila CBS 110553 TaxID=1182543 RepID=W9VDU8_9EURO|nr:uncharacterized protein A1O5_13099 [Cladophialophora psammophila CBS 110553]EXJ53648.1 hypothetical protein A1O5_13099 [Cladophialophora psammophila CBS 110553]